MLQSVILLLSSIPGASFHATPDPQAKSTPVNCEMLDAKQVTFYAISINSAYPPKGALDSVLDQMRPYFSGDLVLEGPIHKKLSEVGKMDINTIVVRNKEINPSPNVVMLIFVPEVQGGLRGLNTTFEDGHQQIVFNAEGIAKMVMPMFSERQAWEVVIAHELGHSMGIPSAADHKWSESHCTDPSCLMYPTMDARSVLRSVVSLGPPTKFCKRCKSEISSCHENKAEKNNLSHENKNGTEPCKF